jgi:hypothetical protein
LRSPLFPPAPRRIANKPKNKWPAHHYEAIVNSTLPGKITLATVADEWLKKERALGALFRSF